MLNKHIVVDNIINEKSQITFILESPHKNEICEGYPLAGQAGEEISKYLIKKSNLPFGKEVKEGILSGKVSILNVSKSPLQSSAYCCDKNKPTDINVYEKLKKLIEQGASYSTQHREEKINTLKKVIYSSFLSELTRLPNHSVIVPCGKFAREFCKQSKLEERLKKKNFEFINEDIPHPARGQWHKIPKNTIEKMKNYCAGEN